MKRILFFVILFSIAGLSTKGQSTGFGSGLRLGIAGTQVNGDRLSGFNKVGIVGGLFITRHFNKSFSWQFEMVYVQKGSRKPTTKDNTYYLLRVNYIELPLMIR